MNPPRRHKSFVTQLLEYIVGYSSNLPVTFAVHSKHDPKQRGESKMRRNRTQRQKMTKHNKRQKRMNPQHGKRA